MNTMKKLFVVCAFLLMGKFAEAGDWRTYATSTTMGASISSAASNELVSVWLSTGYNIGTSLVCYDSATLDSSKYGLNTNHPQGLAFPAGQMVFPPIPFLPSTATISGLPLFVSLANNIGYAGGGRRIDNGLACYVQGTDLNLYTWSVEVEQTQTRRR